MNHGTPVVLPSGRYLIDRRPGDGSGYGLIRHDGVSRAAALSCASRIGMDLDDAEWGDDASPIARAHPDSIGLPGQNWLVRVARVDEP
jgi:hypothetical protein